MKLNLIFPKGITCSVSTNEVIPELDFLFVINAFTLSVISPLLLKSHIVLLTPTLFQKCLK